MRPPPFRRRAAAALLFIPLLGCEVPGEPIADAEPAAEKAPVPPADGGERSQRVLPIAYELRQLRSLPYAEATVDPEIEKRGVVLYDRERTFDGINFFSSRDLPAAFLIDMEGELLYQWRGTSGKWQHVDLLPDGSVLVLIKDEALFKVDLGSRVQWLFQARVHHDNFRTPDGRIFVLTRKKDWRPEIHPRHAMLLDYITILSQDGEKMEEHSVLELFQRSRFAFLLPSLRLSDWTQDGERPEDVALDFLHTNHVEVMDGSLASRSQIFAEGNVLIATRHMNTIAIADLKRREVIWAWGPTNLTLPHHPTVVDGGNVLIFNNGYQQSSVLELDPTTFEIVWRYEPGEEFFSASRGSNQRLPNGNTLITESDPGYVLEVTREGELVWEFANPHVTTRNERSAVWRMVRFRRDELPFLEKPGL